MKKRLSLGLLVLGLGSDSSLAYALTIQGNDCLRYTQNPFIKQPYQRTGGKRPVKRRNLRR